MIVDIPEGYWELPCAPEAVNPLSKSILHDLVDQEKQSDD